MQTNASKFQTATIWSLFAVYDVIFSGRSSEFWQSFIRSKIFHERRYYWAKDISHEASYDEKVLWWITWFAIIL